MLAGALACVSCGERAKVGTPPVPEAPKTAPAAESNAVNTGDAIREQTLTLTPGAAEHLRMERDKKHLKKNAVVRFRVLEGNFFRLKGGGEKRYRYSMLLDDDVKDWDNFYVMESQGFTVIVDKDSVEFLRGTELFWIQAGEKGGLKLQNPNELGDDSATQELEPIPDRKSSPSPVSPTPLEE